MKLLIAVATVGLSACALTSPLTEPDAHRVSINSESYLINQLTASTWTASATGLTRPLAGDSSNRKALLQAIEKISGCQVTDSDYSRQGMQLDAQIDCGSRLQN
ncbi:hypothetical protein LP416_30560 [Polaromonas sp. P2-4]|nr:hypothetical protein LP416_30560 [Polaromonas sp. P2-4]